MKLRAVLLASSMSLVAVNAMADTISLSPKGVLLDKTELPADHGLQEASAQYLIHYTSISGVDGKTRREDSGAVFLPKGPAPAGLAGRGLDPRHRGSGDAMCSVLEPAFFP